jgi:CHASE2 domain-containing sensor protein
MMFFASWMALFDILTLDTRIETYTMALGNSLRQSPVSERLALVVIDEATEKRFGRPVDKSWRREHARLIAALSAAGADAVAFDLFMSERSVFDEELVAASRSAARVNTRVIFGTQDGTSSFGFADGDDPALGLLCAGSRLGYATLIPLSVSGNKQLLALALRAAYPDATVEEIDERAKQVLLATAAGLKRVGFAQLEEVAKKQRHCPALARGDVVAQLIVEFRRLQDLRDPRRRHRYEDIIDATGLRGTERFRGKIVLVGYATDRDMVSVPRGLRVEERYGFEVHADALNTLLHGTHIHSLDRFNQLLVMLGMGALGGLPRLARSLTTPLRRRIYLAGVLAAYVAISMLIYVELDILLNAAYHMGACLIAYWALGRAARKLKA